MTNVRNKQMILRTHRELNPGPSSPNKHIHHITVHHRICPGLTLMSTPTKGFPRPCVAPLYIKESQFPLLAIVLEEDYFTRRSVKILV